MVDFLINFYNKNRYRILFTVIVIVFAFGLLYVTGNYIKKQNNNSIQQEKVSSQASQNNTEEYISTSNSLTNQQKNASEVEIIEEFISYCNKNDLENAYNMITDSCKKEMFGNLDEFKDIYYEGTFKGKAKEAFIDKWAGNTYLIKLTENALATGKIAKTYEDQNIDYITVVEENNEKKLNINGYVGYKEINATETKTEVTIDVVGANIYMDYAIYDIIVKNNSNSEVVLDTLEDINSIYIEDSKEVRYSSYGSELTKEMLTLSGGDSRKLRIKFLSKYVSTKDIKQLVFSDYRLNNVLSTFGINL